MKFPKAKEYPKTISVNDETYQVRMVKRIPGQPATDNGFWDGDNRIIYIRSTQSPRGLFRTFIHEVLHAISYEWTFTLKHKTVYKLEVALDAILADNF